MMAIVNAMGIFRPSKRSLVEYINEANGSPLTAEELIFGIPAPIAGTWREDNTDKNTIIRITAKPTSVFRETTLIMYDRLDLAVMNDMVDFKIKVYVPETTHDLLTPIWRRFGIFIDPEDTQDLPLSDALVEEGEDYQVIRLTAKEDAIGWTGSCTIELREGDAVLGDYLTEDHLLGLNYPVEGDGSYGSAIVYMYGLDFTSQKDVLETYPVDMELDEYCEDLLEAIKAVDVGAGSSLWNLDPESTEWSLHGAEIVYNGINSQALPTNSKAKYVLGIKLADRVTTPPGVMYLHYDDPFDPNEI